MKDKKDIIKYKFALFGDTQVGKTAIFHKISTGIFLDNNLSTQGTDKEVINYTDLEIDINGNKIKKSFKITLFDTAGQERYRSITNSYIKNTDGVILIYDITNKLSFEHVEEWLSSIKNNLSDWRKSDYLIMILGNKLDLASKVREVNFEEVKNKYENSGIILGGEYSAKDFSDIQLLDIFKNFTIRLFKKIGEIIIIIKIKKLEFQIRRRKNGVNFNKYKKIKNILFLINYW